MKIITVVLFLLICFNLSAQSSLKKAEKLYNSKAYTEAAELYDEILVRSTQSDSEILLKAADAHFFINNNREAADLYTKAFAAVGDLDEVHFYRYYRSMRGIREYERSDKLYIDYFRKRNNLKEVSSYSKKSAAFYEIMNDTVPSRFSLMNLEVNTPYSEFSPVIYKDRVIFSSSRPGASKELYAWNEQPYLSLYTAKKKENGDLEEVELFSKQINSDFHDATIAFVPESDVVFFTSSYAEKSKLILDNGRTNHFILYRGLIKDGKIVEKEELFFNSKEYSVGHPSVSTDGKYLFFASDMPEGYGGADIYYCKIYEDGMISSPINAGAMINTWGNDFFPHFSNGTLYFASDGHLGFGGLDLFESEFGPDEKLTAAVNLGKNVNTVYDDFGIIFDNTGESGYLSSNRKPGRGDDDLYYFKRKPLACDQIVYGNVKDQKDNSPLSNAMIRLKDSLGIDYTTVMTDSLGNYSYEIPCGHKITLSASKTGYFEQTKDTITGQVDREMLGPINFLLENAEDRIVKDDKGVEKIKMDPIYFDYDKWEVTPEAAVVLDKAVELMTFYPDMVIKIEAHTDSRGSASYNLSLSDKRAKSTRDYLFSKGIEEFRITNANGFGESRLLNECSDRVKCSEDQHDVNRRSDFIIISR